MDPFLLDDASFRIALELQRQELAEFEEQSQAQPSSSKANDLETAVISFKNDLECVLQQIGDRQICRTLNDNAGAAPAPQPAARPDIRGLANEEQIPAIRSISDEVSNTTVAVSGGLPQDVPADEQASAIDQENEEEKDILVDYISCGDKLQRDGALAAPCSHTYCGACIQTLFQAATTDESLFPPRCCKQPISLEVAMDFLGFDVFTNFTEKKVEFETKDRTYCHERHCSAFIPSDSITGIIANCPKCPAQTCAQCKGESHNDTVECPNDSQTAAVLKLAETEGWKKCSSCKQMIELRTGCNHMTCRCGYQFCYACGKRWQTCFVRSGMKEDCIPVPKDLSTATLERVIRKKGFIRQFSIYAKIMTALIEALGRKSLGVIHATSVTTPFSFSLFIVPDVGQGAVDAAGTTASELRS